MKDKVKIQTNNAGHRSSTNSAGQKTAHETQMDKKSSWEMTAQDALHVNYVT